MAGKWQGMKNLSNPLMSQSFSISVTKKALSPYESLAYSYYKSSAAAAAAETSAKSKCTQTSASTKPASSGPKPPSACLQGFKSSYIQGKRS